MLFCFSAFLRRLNIGALAFSRNRLYNLGRALGYIAIRTRKGAVDGGDFERFRGGSENEAGVLGGNAGGEFGGENFAGTPLSTSPF